jgi:hypothetical protein
MLYSTPGDLLVASHVKGVLAVVGVAERQVLDLVRVSALLGRARVCLTRRDTPCGGRGAWSG